MARKTLPKKKPASANTDAQQDVLRVLSNIRTLLLRKSFSADEIPAFMEAVEYLQATLADYKPVDEEV